MIDDMRLALLRTQLQQQPLVPCAIDATADALRRWYATSPTPLSLADLALYPHSVALDLTEPGRPLIATRIDVGLPTAWAEDDADDTYTHLGTGTRLTDLAGHYQEDRLVMEPPPLDVVWWRAHAPAAADRRPPRFPVTAHGTTDARRSLYAPVPTAHRAAPLVAELAAALNLSERIAAAHMEGMALLAQALLDDPDDYGGWTPAQVHLTTASVRLFVPEDARDHAVVRVELDIWGQPPGSAPQSRLGMYTRWTHLDGTYDDDYYHLPRVAETAAITLAIAADLLRDLPHLTPKRQATLRRLVEAVGEDGLRRLLREARTRLAEGALTDPRPTRPKSVRAMLWHMLQTDALDGATRAYVLGLTRARRTA